MPPQSTKKTTDYCDPPKGILCPEIIELRVIVKNIGAAVLDIEHLILGNGKDGMKVEQPNTQPRPENKPPVVDVAVAEL